MLKNIKTHLNKLIFSVIRIALAVVIFFELLKVLPTVIVPVSTDFKSGLIKEVAPYIRPLHKVDGSRYCSSSVVSFVGKTYTVTNNHCCDADFFAEDFRLVGGYAEKILHNSEDHDICILTSEAKSSPIKLAVKRPEILDPLLLMGYPRGGYLTPRFGYLVAKNVPIDTGDGPHPANIITSITYGGNSGSPIMNVDGEIVGVLYAGSRYIHTYGAYVPYHYLLKSLLEVRFE